MPVNDPNSALTEHGGFGMMPEQYGIRHLETCHDNCMGAFVYS